jgi:hypothetical protein
MRAMSEPLTKNIFKQWTVNTNDLLSSRTEVFTPVVMKTTPFIQFKTSMTFNRLHGVIFLTTGLRGQYIDKYFSNSDYVNFI